MTYQTANQIKSMEKALAVKTVSYDENGLYIRRKKWVGMNWISHTRRLAIYLRDNLQCCYCGKTLFDSIKLTLDHVTPVATYEGPQTDAVNLVTCCTNCNFRKQDLSLATFAKIIAKEKGISPAVIVRRVKKAQQKGINMKQAGKIVKEQKNWNNIFTHLK